MCRIIAAILATVLCAQCLHAEGWSIGAIKVGYAIMKNVAVRVESYAGADHKVATGYFSKLASNNDHYMLITARHVFLNADSLTLTIPIVDSAFYVVDTNRVTLALYSNQGDSLFAISKRGLDIGATLAPKNLVNRKGTGTIFSAKAEINIPMKSLFLGQEVVIAGYPLGLSINNIESLLRFGRIAGIDTLRREILVDAQIFGGSSGSPVFIDPSRVWNAEIMNEYDKWLVGIVSGHKPYNKFLVNKETGNVEMVQTENSGLAVVIPLDGFQELATEALNTILPRLNQGP